MDFEYKNVLVTGGCGFIGSNIINYFVTKYQHINFYNIDRLDYCASQRNINVNDNQNYNLFQVTYVICH